MQTDDWQKIMTLLTVIIMADKRVYKEEVDMFTRSVVKLNKKLSPGIFMTPKMAFDWFVDNRDRVQAAMTSEDKHDRIDGLILSVSHLPGRNDILRTMFAIAKADSDYHSNERHIVKRAAEAWGLPMPRAH